MSGSVGSLSAPSVSASQPLTITVIVPTYRRPERLQPCLDALAGQVRRADQVIVVCRADDAISLELVQRNSSHVSGLTVATVDKPGVIYAMNTGLAAASGEVVALTDDDAVPWRDWLERIERHFLADHKLGALGGRDWQYKGDPLKLDDGHETRSGHLQWWGRFIGQHHWAAPGPAREVTIIKGVNCAFRAKALHGIGGFDERLAGTGAQVHWELSLGLAMRQRGWRVVFDPALGVDHFPAQRFDEDQRGRFDSQAVRNAVYNETLVLAEWMPLPRRVVFWIWAYAVGTTGAPGLMQVLRRLATRKPHVMPQWYATLRGRQAGFRQARLERRRRSQSELGAGAARSDRSRFPA